MYKYALSPLFFLAISLSAMETSQPLSIESFSYSWLVNLKPSLDGLDGSLRASIDDEASFIEMDPRMPPSRRFFRNSQDFKFDFPISQTPITLVHADELFSDGRVVPLFVNNSKIEAYHHRVSDQNSTLPTTTRALDLDVPMCKTNRQPPQRRCRRLSKRIFSKYLNFLRPLYRSVLRRNKSSGRAESIDPRGHVRKNWLYSTGTSPRISVAYSADEWRKSCDSESSIYEAVLHCKKSIGK